MTACKFCNINVSETDVKCGNCQYPLLGSEREQAVFVAQQVMQKSHVSDSGKQTRNARIILFVLGGFELTASLFLFANPDEFIVAILSSIFGLLFIGFGFLTYKRPAIALLIPLILLSLYYTFLVIFSPSAFLQGVLWKFVILTALIYAYAIVARAEKILKKNEYLANEMKSKKRNEMLDDILDSQNE